MKDIITYSGLVTKIRGMEAKLLTRKDFENIANLSSVPDIVEYLKGKDAYREILTRMDESLYHRGNIEKVLEQALYEDFSRIYRFAGMKQKSFIKGLWKQYEIELINYCLRIVFDAAGTSSAKAALNPYIRPFDLDYKKEYFDKYSRISIDKLVMSRTIDELVENLSDTEYYQPLKAVKSAGGATLYDYNNALEQYFFVDTWKKLRKSLKKKELEFYTKDCGTKIDLLNLQWIYRGKKYYRMSPETIYTMVIPIHYRLHADEFRTLVEATDEPRFMAILGDTYYKKYFTRTEEVPSLEKVYKECLYKLYVADRRQNPFSLAAVNTYLFLKGEEINKLTTVLECVRYGLTPGETLDYLGGESW